MTAEQTTKTSETPKIRIAAIYARTSKEDKAQKKVSIEQQIYDAQELAKRNGFTVPLEHIYIDRDVTSRFPPEQFRDGKTKIRPALTQLITVIKDKKIDGLFIRSYDRLFRMCEWGLRFMDILYKQEVDLFATHDPIFSRDASGKFAITVVMASYEMQLNKIRTDTKASVDYRKKNRLNLCGSRSIGYRNEDKKIVVDEHSSIVVKELFNRFINGASIPELSKWMDDTYPDLAFGKKWHYTSIVRVLKNPCYVDGAIQPYPVFLDKAIWLEAQKILSLRKNIRTGFKLKKHLLTNFLLCGHCGKKLQFRYRIGIKRKDGTRKKDGYYYCDCQRVPHIMEKFYLEIVEHMIADAKLANKKTNNAEIVELELKREKLSKNLSDFNKLVDTGDISVSDYNDRKKNIEKELSKVDVAISDIRLKEISCLEIKQWSEMTFDEKREHIDRVVDFIRVVKNGLFLKYKNTVAIDVDAILQQRNSDSIYWFPIVQRITPAIEQGKIGTAKAFLPENFTSGYMWKEEQIQGVGCWTPAYE